mmetsp:Transcript_57513/g.186841  ORF Transcript_57513/g.186841 Transcript_57513/m.186841 type:complete len:214 (-) Transcript_57513:392-1033(-)
MQGLHRGGSERRSGHACVVPFGPTGLEGEALALQRWRRHGSAAGRRRRHGGSGPDRAEVVPGHSSSCSNWALQGRQLQLHGRLRECPGWRSGSEPGLLRLRHRGLARRRAAPSACLVQVRARAVPQRQVQARIALLPVQGLVQRRAPVGPCLDARVLWLQRRRCHHRCPGARRCHHRCAGADNNLGCAPRLGRAVDAHRGWRPQPAQRLLAAA